MSDPIQYNLTNDTVTVFIKGEPHSVAKGAPNYDKLRKAVLDEDWDAVPGLLTVESAIEAWAAHAISAPADPGLHVAAPAIPPPSTVVVPLNIKVQNERVLVDGEALPTELNDRILKMVAKDESPAPIINFWRRLKRNPNERSVKQLWSFLAHCGIPIQPDGTFLAYKGVRTDLRDVHSGKFDNSPGNTIRMDRDKISTDPAQTCHFGLHVGALGYARTFGVRTLIVRVDPEHVCCVPNDYDAMKMRVCEYTVMGLYGSQMPDTVFQADAPVQAAAPAPLEDETVEVDDEVQGTEAVEQTETIPLTGTPWDDFNSLDAKGLAEQNIGDLRKYARYNCRIIGASKLPGGKDTLVAEIIKARAGKPAADDPAPAPKPEPAKAPVEETKPAPAGHKGMEIPRTGTEWDRLNDLDSVQLMKEGIETLRKYATYNCLIVGASKMPGGKLPLVTRICEVRGDANK